MIQSLRTINWKAFAALLTAGLLGVLAVMPFVFHLIGGHAFGQTPAPDIPIPMVVALALVQNAVLLALMIISGMALAERLGLKMPLISAWTQRGPLPEMKAITLPGLLLGAAAGAAMVAVEAIFFLTRLPAEMLPIFDIPLWKRLLAGVLYGGITEELIMRLFFVSLTARLLGKWFKAADGPAPAAYWGAIILVAILFGLGHLPVTAAITPLTPLIVARALVLNGLAGIVFGYLYWRHGLEAAMLGHMSAHLVLQAPGVALLKSML